MYDDIKRYAREVIDHDPMEWFRIYGQPGAAKVTEEWHVMPPEINYISAVDPRIVLAMIDRLEHYESKENGLA